MKYLIYLIPLTILLSCTDDIPMIEEPVLEYPEVDARLWPYFERFEEEGALRGRVMSIANLRIEGIIATINEDHIAGTCQFRGSLPRLVTVDSDFWIRADDLYREFIVFHELGHCVLERDHDESESDNGACLSIMRSGTTGCVDIYSLRTRDYFLDELFSKTGGL